MKFSRSTAATRAGPRWLAGCVAVALSVLAHAGPGKQRAPGDRRGRQFIGVSQFSSFTRESRGRETIFTSPRFKSAVAWDEFILSWNVHLAEDDRMRFEVRGIFPDHATKFYTLGEWSGDPTRHPRTSVAGQRDADGDVHTDTLALHRPGAELELRITTSETRDVALRSLKFLGLSFTDTRARLDPLPPQKSAWGKTLPVPELSQMNHPEGKTWCSPASTAMTMQYWAARLRRPEFACDIPETARGVFDPAWPGTGNWPFNTAFVGARPGLRAYVTRLSDLAELELWIARDVPVVLSVAYSVLRGSLPRESDGHVVVCVGFTSQGDPILNDPGTSRDIRQVVPRARLAQAWRASHHTVYLIHPESLTPPRDRFGHWFVPASR